MKSEIKQFSYPDGTLQRVQLVHLDRWEELEFRNLGYSHGALDCFANILRQYLISACPWIFGQLVLFHIRSDVAVPFPWDTRYGEVGDGLTAAAIGLKQGVRIVRGKPKFRNQQAKAFWEALESRDCIRIVSGKLPTTQFMPVGGGTGFLSETEDARMKVNASFFIMDPIDCATVHDHVGTCLGLMVKDGVVTNPPLYNREALLVMGDGTVTVKPVDIRDLEIEIGGIRYRDGRNCRIYTRPHCAHAPSGRQLVIVGNKVAAVVNGRTAIPASGYVLRPEGGCGAKPGDAVVYHGMEEVAFGIQVGNSIVRNGVKTEKFRSRFYNIRHLEPVPFPPSLYPMDFHGGRAARIALGADEQGKPMLLWAEGAPKIGYVPGKHSRGASLSDMAGICLDCGMVNAVNLDGGGSAQILLGKERLLEISDRKADGSQSERPVPNALILK